MTDETMQDAAIIMCRLMSFFYFIKPEIISICPCLSIRHYHQHGQFITTPASLTTYAAIQCHPDIQNYSFGFQLAEIAENLCHRNMNKHFLPYVIKVRYGFVTCWQKDTYHCIEKMKEGVQAALDVGDNEMAAYCYYNNAMFLFSSGIKLGDALNECNDIVSSLEMLGNEEMLGIGQQMLFMIECFVNTSSQSEKINNIDNLSNIGYQQLLLKLIQHYYQHEYTSACHCARQAITFMHTVSYSSHITSWLAFYGALSFLSLTEASKKYSEETSKYIELMEIYYKKLPGILDNKYYLVKAMESYKKGEINLTIDFFEKAIICSREKKLIHDEALSHELAAEFFLSQEKTNTAELYLEAALKLYMEWGAHGITQCIKHRYPQLMQQIPPATTEDTATWEFFEKSDFKSINEAILTMTRKRDSDRPFYHALKYMVKISGAQKGLLFTIENNFMELTELIDTNTNNPIYLAKNYPISVINYVRHSKQMLITSDGSDNTYIQDTYLKQNIIKSFLCMPLMFNQHQKSRLYFF